jgi:hypothetical protein
MSKTEASTEDGTSLEDAMRPCRDGGLDKNFEYVVVCTLSRQEFPTRPAPPLTKDNTTKDSLSTIEGVCLCCATKAMRLQRLDCKQCIWMYQRL